MIDGLERKMNDRREKLRGGENEGEGGGKRALEKKKKREKEENNFKRQEKIERERNI